MATKNNWLTTNISERLTNPAADFKVTVNNFDYEKKPFHVACDEAAIELSKIYPKIFIPLSGGMDSEYVLETFYRNNLPFTVIIVDTPGNIYESSYAYHNCKSKNIEPIVIHKTESDMITIFYKDIFNKLNGYGHNSVAALIAAKYAKQNGGVAIIGEHGFAGTNEWDFYNDALIGDEYSINFFLYNLDIHVSMVSEFNNFEDKNEQEFKHKLYKVPFRPKIKYQYGDTYNLALEKIKQKRTVSPKWASNITINK